MKIGIQQITNSCYGMPENHINAFRTASREMNAPIGVRPVSAAAKYYLERGDATKPFLIKKAKTSDRGLTSGLIPIKSQHGRSLSISEEEYFKMIKEIQEEDEAFVETELILEVNRVKELRTLLGADITISPIRKSNDLKVTWICGKELVKVYAIWNGSEQNYHIVDETGDPLLVLGKKINKDTVYVTTDYDLLVICPSYETLDFHKQDKAPFRTQGSLTTHSKNQEQVLKSGEEGYEGPQEDPNKGNITQRVASAIEVINRAIAEEDALRGESGREMVHHNIEFTNPFADNLQRNLPALIVFPKAMDLSNIAHLIQDDNSSDLSKVTELLLERPEELVIIRDYLRDEGYYWPAHAKYADQLPSFREESVQAAKNAVANMRKSLQKIRDDEESSAENVNLIKNQT